MIYPLEKSPLPVEKGLGEFQSWSARSGEYEIWFQVSGIEPTLSNH
jgi:hypothetical protein